MRILLVDDEPGLAASYAEFLRRRFPGHEIEVALDATSARSAAATPFDLIITDFDLGRDDIMPFLEHCKSMQPPPRVVLQSAYASDAQMAQLQTDGLVARTMLKPFPIQELVNEVESLA